MLADPIQLDYSRSKNGCAFHTWIAKHIRIRVMALLSTKKTSAKSLWRKSEIQELNYNVQAVFWSAVSVNVMASHRLFSLLYHHHQYCMFSHGHLSHISHSVLKYRCEE